MQDLKSIALEVIYSTVDFIKGKDDIVTNLFGRLVELPALTSVSTTLYTDSSV